MVYISKWHVSPHTHTELYTNIIGRLTGEENVHKMS